MEVAVVAAGEAFDNGAGCCAVAEEAGSFGADEFEDIGVVFLGHDTAAGAYFGGEDEVAKFGHGVEDKVFGEAGEGEHNLGEGSEDDRFAFTAGVAGVEDVVVRGTEAKEMGGEVAVEREGDTVTGGRAEGGTVVVSVGGFDGEEVVEEGFGVGGGPEADAGGHGGLEVGTPDHGDFGVFAGKAEEGGGEVGGFDDETEEVFAAMETEIDGDLIVAAATGVDTATEFAEGLGEAAFDCEVDVLIGDGDFEITLTGIGHNIDESGDDSIAVSRGHNGRGVVHGGEGSDVGGGADTVPFGEL